MIVMNWATWNAKLMDQVKSGEYKLVAQTGLERNPDMNYLIAINTRYLGEAALGGNFVGGHPMAGSERHGIEAADPELFVQVLVLNTTP